MTREYHGGEHKRESMNPSKKLPNQFQPMITAHHLHAVGMGPWSTGLFTLDCLHSLRREFTTTAAAKPSVKANTSPLLRDTTYYVSMMRFSRLEDAGTVPQLRNSRL